MSKKKSALDGITPYIYGTTRLGDDKIPKNERIKTAHAAMDSGVWFHASRAYGDALEVLGAAFAEDPQKIPGLIIKIGWDNINQLRSVIDENLKPLGLKGVQLGQLCMQGGLAEDFANGGSCYKVFQQLKDEGLVNGYVVEVFPWTSAAPLKALCAGYTKGIVEGFIFYLNPLQRFASNELWNEIAQRKEPVIAMRTVSGGNIYKLRDAPGYAWKEYLQKRAAEVIPVFEKSGIKSWTEFCVRFAHSFPTVIATVGSTARIENLKEFLSAKEKIKPLPGSIIKEIEELHYRWSHELDIHAEPWTM
ncbi:MAG TPA: aldo/keto reductase [Ignavibacteriaceae bacterium]|nr:aldo/keto reductase [Ignavibacteriaceae bacterium]